MKLHKSCVPITFREDLMISKGSGVSHLSSGLLVIWWNYLTDKIASHPVLLHSCVLFSPACE